jgi:hypothetical protein
MPPMSRRADRPQRPDRAANPAEPVIPDLHDTPLAAVVPTRRPGERVPKWEKSLDGFRKALYLACGPRTYRTYLEAIARFIQEVGDPLEADAAAVEAFLARELTGRQGRAVGPRASSSRTVELSALRRSTCMSGAAAVVMSMSQDGVGPSLCSCTAALGVMSRNARR